jgi:hypothetical protein
MLHECSRNAVRRINRRDFVRVGLAGLGALGLTDLFRLQALASPSGRSPKSILVVWLWGGPSHMETFDMKPDAPAEYRGEFKPIRTNVPGLNITEHLPRLARMADKFALIRSMSHDSTGHMNSTHTMLTAYPGEPVETPPNLPKHPDIWTVANRMLGTRTPGVPAYVCIPRTRHTGPGYLGPTYDPLAIRSDPNSQGYEPPQISIEATLRPRFRERMDLLRQFDTLRRDIDGAGQFQTLDQFQQEAVNVLTSDAARKAFNVASEDPRTRDRYGRNEVGQRCLLARRLIEAGARVVQVDFPSVPGQKAFSWDDHSLRWNIFEEMRTRLPVLDQVVTALIEDIHQRGLQDDVLLLVMGEMSHTPRISADADNPGREHWGRAMSLLLSGGGMPMGQVIGSTDSRGEEPRDRPLTPNEFQATLYQFLGIPLDTHLIDPSGRPVPLVPSGGPIRELVG